MKILKGELENMLYPTRNQKWNYSFTKFLYSASLFGPHKSKHDAKGV